LITKTLLYINLPLDDVPVYVDMGNVATDTTTLAFTFTGTSTTRLWEIKVSQLTCSNANRYGSHKT